MIFYGLFKFYNLFWISPRNQSFPIPFSPLPDCVPGISIHDSTTPGFSNAPGYNDPTQLLVEGCDAVVDGKANYFLGPQRVFGHKIVLDLNCVVLISEIHLKNGKNGDIDE